jgi:hypothetical protein
MSTQSGAANAARFDETLISATLLNFVAIRNG